MSSPLLATLCGFYVETELIFVRSDAIKMVKNRKINTKKHSQLVNNNKQLQLCKNNFTTISKTDVTLNCTSKSEN